MSEYDNLFEQWCKIDNRAEFHKLDSLINIVTWGYDKGINYLTGHTNSPFATMIAFYSNHNCDCYLTLEHETEQWHFKIEHGSGTYEAQDSNPRDAIYQTVLQWHDATGLFVAKTPKEESE